MVSATVTDKGLSDVDAAIQAQNEREAEARRAPPVDYDHDKYPFGPPTRGKFTPRNPGAKYKLLVSQYVGEDGVLYLAGVPGRDIVPESTKHPDGLARWPEKFQRLTEDRYTDAVRRDETLEELKARVTEMELAQKHGPVPQTQPPQGSGSSESSTIDHMTYEELCAYCQEQEINPRGAKDQKSLLKIVKAAEGIK